MIIMNSNEECFICLEKETNEKLINMNDLRYYYWTSCECNAKIHHTCFRDWIKKKENCPLCRKNYFSKTASCIKFVKNTVFISCYAMTMPFFIYCILFTIHIISYYIFGYYYYNLLHLS